MKPLRVQRAAKRAFRGLILSVTISIKVNPRESSGAMMMASVVSMYVANIQRQPKSRVQRIQRLYSAAILESGAVSYVRQREALSLIGLDPANTVFLLRAEPCLLVAPFSLARQFSHFISNISPPACPRRIGRIHCGNHAFKELRDSQKSLLSNGITPPQRSHACASIFPQILWVTSASPRLIRQEPIGKAACSFPTKIAHRLAAPQR